MPFRYVLLAFICSATPWAVEIRGGETPGAAQVANVQRIDRLIRQLGSDDYEERESATQALARVGGPALDALRKAASTNPDPEVRWRANEVVVRVENSLDQLLADYRAFGLPLPPDAAPFVRFEKESGGGGWVCYGEDKEQPVSSPPIYALGFLVEPAAKERPAKLLHATETWEREAKQVGPTLDPQQLTADFLKVNLPDPPQALVFALQMHARGWDAAKVLFEKGFHEKAEHSPRTGLRLLAWDYWDRRLTDATDDCWPTAARQMKALLAGEPELNTPEHRGLLKSLEAALVPSKAKPGSVESLIDDLVHAGGAGLNYDPASGRPADERFVRVFDLGFDAVPALLGHLDDDRLTRYLEPPPMIFSGVFRAEPPPYHYRVGDMAGDLFRCIAGADATRDWPKGRNDRPGEKRAAQDWWEEARRQGEEAYLIDHVLPPARKDRPSEDQWPEMGQVRLLGRKYPRRLAGVYRDVLENHPLVQSWPLADALTASSLPREDKVGLFVLAAGDRSLENRRAALWQLKDLDAERFITLLAATLDGLPRTPTVPYPVCCEATFATLVRTTDDPRAWRALERAARRADAGLRMEILDNTNRPRSTTIHRRQRLAFLAAFLEDDAIRDVTVNPKMFEPIYAGFRFRRLEIRNFAALRISEILETPADPTPEWNAEQWAKLRDQMRAALKRELAEDAKE